MNEMEWKIAWGLILFAALMFGLALYETLYRWRQRTQMRTVVEEQIHCILADCGWYDADRNRNEVP